MPRYSIALLDDREDRLYREEVPLPDKEAAWYQAVRSARELAANAGPQQAAPDLRLKVEDEEGLPIWDMALEEMIRLTA